MTASHIVFPNPPAGVVNTADYQHAEIHFPGAEKVVPAPLFRPRPRRLMLRGPNHPQALAPLIKYLYTIDPHVGTYALGPQMHHLALEAGADDIMNTGVVDMLYSQDWNEHFSNVRGKDAQGIISNPAFKGRTEHFFETMKDDIKLLTMDDSRNALFEASPGLYYKVVIALIIQACPNLQLLCVPTAWMPHITGVQLPPQTRFGNTESHHAYLAQRAAQRALRRRRDSGVGLVH